MLTDVAGRAAEFLCDHRDVPSPSVNLLTLDRTEFHACLTRLPSDLPSSSEQSDSVASSGPSTMGGLPSEETEEGEEGDEFEGYEA